MFLPGRNCNGIARFHIARLAFNADFSSAVRDEINFLGARMIMFLCAGADGQSRLGEALVANRRIAIREQFADLGTILRDEWFDFIQIFNVHKFCAGQKLSGRRKIFAQSICPSTTPMTIKIIDTQNVGVIGSPSVK
jgi:hypothetical protein